MSEEESNIKIKKMNEVAIADVILRSTTIPMKKLIKMATETIKENGEYLNPKREFALMRGLS